MIKLEDHLHGLEIDDLIDVMTFLAVEKAIASGLRERVQTTADTINADEVRAIATRRQDGHWASPDVAGAPEVPRKALHAVYDALVAAADFYRPAEPTPAGFDFPDAAGHVPGLRDGALPLRPTCIATSARRPTRPKSPGWDILKPLRADMEACYINWYLPKLALAWGKFIEPQGPAC